MPSVSTQVTWIAVGYAALVAILAVVALVRWRAWPPWLGSMVWMLEFLVGVRVLIALGAMGSGQRPDSMLTHVGYLVASLAVLPIAMRATVTDEQGDEGRWSLGVLLVAVVAVGVLVLRLEATA